MTDIKKVAVIGSGVMGSGIAAQVANAGIEVILLDIVPEGSQNRNAIAEGAIAKLLKTKPAPLMHKRNAKLIQAGNLEDDLGKLSDCDWIIEVIVEQLDIKQALYQKIQEHRKQGSIVSSNTSTLPLQMLTEGQSKEFNQDFMITHFFNPPRYMRLLEIVVGEATDANQEKRVRDFVDIKMGKSIVDCNDTPGFIANRIGTYWLHAAVSLAVKQGIGVEEADALLSRPAGVPKTGVFGLVDLVGVDLMPYLFKSFDEALSDDDPFKAIGDMPSIVSTMINDGYTGRKGKGGFYRLNTDSGAKVKEVIDLQSGSYSKAQNPKVKAAIAAKKGGLRALLTHDSDEGRYAWDVLAGTLSYAASLVPEIADNIELVDRAMKLGYNWKKGPFELIDELGTDWFIEKLEAKQLPVPKTLSMADGRKFYREKNGLLQYLSVEGRYEDVQRPSGVLLLEDVKRKSKRLFGNSQASVWDLGDGVACFEFHSKMNSLNPFIMSALAKANKVLPKQNFKGMVIYNEGSNFSVGANILMLLLAAKLRLGFAMRWILRQGQFTLRDMKYGKFPVVGAPSGMALGGGCEVILHCNAVEAYAETYIGLVEVGVGIVPGWGGCKELLLRGQASEKIKKGPMPAIANAFETIAMAKVSTSAQEAKDMLFLNETDGIVMNRDRVLSSAKARVLKMAQNYIAPEKPIIKLPGETAIAALSMAVEGFTKTGVATPHDATIAYELMKVLSGNGVEMKDIDINDELDEDYILKLERDALVKLSATKQSKARISHMLSNGKALRN